ncbi:MAG: MerR family transcriptional regulator [Methanomicrobiales archaeon HGW-Methanomicrobiales-3]|jgi:effector-binding domain-containing protein|nr:MAG: MerR family transcriptional regulator [Methanomicrobiales archaeon HGW-Methanomicrobiales-3]
MAYDRIPIGRFSLITRLSPKALRLYDERGLLVPATKDIATGYRYYTGTQIATGVSIKELCALGFSLAEIETILVAKDTGDRQTVQQLFCKRRTLIRSEVRRLQQIEALLSETGASLEMMYMSFNEPVVKETAPQRILGKRGVGMYADCIARLMKDLCGQIFSETNMRNGVKVTGPFMSIYHDQEYRETDATVECAAPFSGKITVSDPEMEVRTLPGGTCLSLIYKGPYSGLHGAWCRIGAYAEEREFLATGPHREIYLNDPDTVTENELLTELQIPIDIRARGKIS